MAWVGGMGKAGVGDFEKLGEGNKIPIVPVQIERHGLWSFFFCPLRPIARLLIFRFLVNNKEQE